MNKNNSKKAMQSEIKEIIRSCQKGDKKAFKSLVENQKVFAYQVALTYVNSVDDALDISQDAFIKVLRNIKSYDLSKPFTPWFFQIIKNLCFSFLRKNKRKDRLDDVKLSVLRSYEPDALETQTDSEKSQLLVQEVNALPEEMRVIIIMKEYQNLSYKEIAACMNVPIGTVMSRLYNARQLLKKNILEVYDE